MSENEKRNAIPAEGTVEEPKKMPWYKRLWANKWVRRITKGVGAALGVAGVGVGAYEWGYRNGKSDAKVQEVLLDEPDVKDDNSAE